MFGLNSVVICPASLMVPWLGRYVSIKLRRASGRYRSRFSIVFISEAALSQLTFAQPKLILASGSPRRAEILQAVGWPFEIAVSGIDESRLAGEDPVSYVQRLA